MRREPDGGLRLRQGPLQPGRDAESLGLAASYGPPLPAARRPQPEELVPQRNPDATSSDCHKPINFPTVLWKEAFSLPLKHYLPNDGSSEF